VLTNSEPDRITALTEELAATILPIRHRNARFSGDPSLLAGKYRGPGRGGSELVIEVTQTPEGLTFAFDAAVPAPLPWVEGWTFRRGDALLMFRRPGTAGPATELRFDTGGGHIILKRQ
jgi:hypothetical protein